MATRSNLRGSTRKARRERSRELYLAGKSRGPYKLNRSVNESLTESSADEQPSTSRAGSNLDICSKCHPVLSRYKDEFKSMKKQGTRLKKAKRINPVPKRTDLTQYRDLKAQNDWLRANMFDSRGNYLYCAKCIRLAFGISKQRLARQRKMKQDSSREPIVQMTKAEVEEKRLSDAVIMPSDCDEAFSKWWRSIAPEEVLSVRYPHERHGLAGRVSNSAKSDTLQDFLTFVDANSQPNGRSMGSYCPTHYFISKFTTIQTPKQTVKNYDQRCTTSLAGEFNRIQQEQNKPTISNYSASTWLKKHRPKHAICPHKLDYCDTCAGLKTQIQSSEMRLKRLLQSGSSSSTEIKAVETEKEHLQLLLDTHKEEASDSHRCHSEAVKRCKETWEKITELEGTEDSDELQHLKESFVLVICADYQQSKLIPYWGNSPQPRMTYYLQKMSYDVFGIVDCRDDQGYVYLVPETIGHKNTDHTLSYLYHFLRESGQIPSWVTRIHLFLDNACSTNKNFYMTAFCQELVQQEIFSFFRLSFMIAGHTKFNVDRLFSKIAISYNRSDIFNIDDLAAVVRLHVHVVTDAEGEIVKCWREQLGQKFTKLPGIRSLHDFVTVRHLISGEVIMRVRKLCYTGAFEPTKMKLIGGVSTDLDAIPKSDYKSTNGSHKLTAKKLDDLKQMYTKFIERGKWPDFLR